MARRKKPSGQLKRGPFTKTDVAAALVLLGGQKVGGTEHQELYKHPVKGWKVPISQAWTSIRKGDPIFNGIARTTGVSPKVLLKAFNGIAP